MSISTNRAPEGTGSAGSRSRFTLWFFSHFFTLLLVFICIAEAITLWWLTSGAGRVPAVAYVLAAPALFLANGFIMARQRRQHATNLRSRLFDFYYAFAFASVFCAVFLMLSGLLALLAKTGLGALTAQALTLQSGTTLDSGIDTIFRWLNDLGVTTIAVSFVYGYSVGQMRLKVAHVPLQLRNAPAAWNGLKIAQISDIHVGHNLRLEELQRFVAQVNALQPDIICITGDIADSARSDLDAFFPTLGQLQAAQSVFAILGNHDHNAGPERVVDALQRHTPFTILRDTAVSLDLRGHRLSLVGLDDRGRDWARGMLEEPALDKVLAHLDPQDPVLLLCHRPDVFPYAARLGVDLMLSGHTHGGQIGMPWTKGRTRNIAQFATRFDRGLFDIDGSQLYVNCGLGVTLQRIRLCTPREITLIELHTSTDGDAAT